MEFAQKSLTLEENSFISKDYSEEIIVPKGVTLLVEGFTNRLITNTGGTVIVKGTCYRINNTSGKVLVEEDGFVHSLYGISKCEVEVKGKVYECIIRDNVKLTVYENSEIKNIDNTNSEVVIRDHAYVKSYQQCGINAKSPISDSSIVSSYIIRSDSQADKD